MKKSFIKNFLHSFRIQRIKNKLIRESLILIIASIIYFLPLSILESIYYFSKSIRLIFINNYLIILSSFIVYSLLKAYLNSKALFNNNNDEFLAKTITINNHKNDQILNALQLENSLEKIKNGKDLAEHAIKKIHSKLKKINFLSIEKPISGNLKNIFLSSLIFSFLMVLLMHNTLPQAFSRLIQPEKYFPKPVPFTLTSLSKNQQILGGDSLTISIAGYGRLPKSINLNWKNKDEFGTEVVNIKNEIYHYNFLNIKKNTIYWASHKSNSLLSPWREIKTLNDTIFVIDRPTIKKATFTITPPIYTNENEFIHPGNMTEIFIPEGSNLHIEGESSKTLENAWLFLDNIKHELFIQNKYFAGIYQIKNNHSIKIKIKDTNNADNRHPPNYKINIIKDAPPDISVISPLKEFELTESNIIGFDFHIADDYGFSDAWLEYKIIKPEYLSPDTTIYKISIHELQKNIRSQHLYYEWYINKSKLAPEDKLHIFIKIADNNIASPSISSSQLMIGKYPTIEDLFNRIENKEEQIEDYSENIQMTLEDVQELVEEIELELLKSEDVSWEQEQKVSEAMEKMDNIFSQIEEIQETMHKIEEEAQKNNLVSEDLIEKFSHFQELLDDMMTPDILEAMEKMQNAMEEMDPQKLLDALENFEFDMEVFEEQLDRFIDMFELALAEQKMDEVIKKIEQLLNEQNAIVKELSNNKNVDLKTLSSRERRQEENFKALTKTMQEASKAMEKISPNIAQKLFDLSENSSTKSIAENLNQARKKMQNNDQIEASNNAQESSNGLNDLLESSQKLQTEFQEETLNQMLGNILALIQNIVFISQKQEDLLESTRNLRSRSPKLIETAKIQDQILRENNQFMLQLIEFSKTTFHITPEIASQIGKTKSAMSKTIAKLEQRKTNSAKEQMNIALDGLNQTGALLLEAANQMQSSGSGSGMEKFMEQMEQMSEAQQGINKGTAQLPQLGMMAQQQMMQKLQQQQQQLKKQLEELLNENPSQESGGLSQANQEMEDVITDFRKNQVNRRTHERQQRILSRMLDSQKSLSQKDFSKKRKSNTAEEVIFSGPAHLPENKGEKDLLLINAMESALKEGHSREYQTMMKQYFNNLQKDNYDENK